MSPSRILFIAAALVATVALFVAPHYLVAQEPARSGGHDGYGTPGAEAIGPTVRQYLLENPEILREMAQRLQEKDAQVADAARADALTEHRARIYDSPDQIVLGNPRGDVTLVEFFDYNCGYCRRSVNDMEALLKSDGELRVVLKELPVLSEGSAEAARVSVAVHRIAPERHLAFHTGLLRSNGEANGTTALKAAADAGVDMQALAKALADPTIDRPIAEAHELAQMLGIDGTPTYVIGDRVMPGAIGEQRLRAMIGNVRKCGKAECS